MSLYNTSLNSGRLIAVDYGHVILNKKFHFPRVQWNQWFHCLLHSHNSHPSKSSSYGLGSLLWAGFGLEMNAK